MQSGLFLAQPCANGKVGADPTEDIVMRKTGKGGAAVLEASVVRDLRADARRGRVHSADLAFLAKRKRKLRHRRRQPGASFPADFVPVPEALLEEIYAELKRRGGRATGKGESTSSSTGTPLNGETVHVRAHRAGFGDIVGDGPWRGIGSHW